MKKILIIVIAILVISQIYLFYNNYQLQNNAILKDKYLEDLNIKYSATEPQFSLNVQNCSSFIDYNIVLTDSINKNYTFSDIFKNNHERLLICRISDNYCDKCVKHALSIIIDNKKSFDFSKIVILSNSNNNRSFKLLINEYSLGNFNVFNCEEFNLPIEKLMFPYYMIVDSTMKVLSVYLPTKSTHGTDFDFSNVKLMYDCLLRSE